MTRASGATPETVVRKARSFRERVCLYVDTPIAMAGCTRSRRGPQAVALRERVRNAKGNGVFPVQTHTLAEGAAGLVLGEQFVEHCQEFVDP